MATYCTERDLKDVFPSIDEFDSKTPLYGWVEDSSNIWIASDCGLITQLFANGRNLGSAESTSVDVDATDEWYYDSTVDKAWFYSTINPNDMLMEAGDDWATIKTRYMANASSYFDSRVDANLPREQFKDQDGDYDYIVVRTTALLACSFLIRASEPTSEIADALFEEADRNIASLNEGSTKLSWQTSGDSSKGIIREGSVSGALRIVDTNGSYSGTYDKIGVKITTAGKIGVAKYSYWAKSDNALGATLMSDGETATYSEIINGSFQPLSNGLYIRFAGDTDDEATLNDYWEIEVSGKRVEVDLGSPRTIRMSRR